MAPHISPPSTPRTRPAARDPRRSRIVIRRSLSVLIVAMLVSSVISIGSPIALVDRAAAQQSDAPQASDPGSDASTPDGEGGAPAPVTPLLSARRFPSALQSTSADGALAAALEPYLDATPGSECVSVLSYGRIVYQRNPDAVMVPASVLKMATATAALDVLGPTTTLTTRFVASAPLVNGVVSGDLFVLGGGNPLLTTPGYQASLDDPDQIVQPFGEVADALVAAGVTRIEGRLIGDDSRHESRRWLTGWPERYQTGGTVAPLSALVVNDGQTGYSESPEQPTTNRRAGDSPLLFVSTLRTELQARGVEVEGVVDTGRAPVEASVEIARHDSLPVADIVFEMLRSSDNTTAELILREMGAVSGGAGTTAAGLEVVRQSLQRQGFDLTGADLRDGSGLDPASRMPCPLMMDLLQAAPADSTIIRSLPTGGRTGTLRQRMQNGISTGRVQAKTGTLNSVNALLGFASTDGGAPLTFVMVHNGNDPRGTGFADGFTDRLVRHGKDRLLSRLGPVAPGQ